MSRPALLWDGRDLSPSLLGTIDIQELVSDACEALWTLFQDDLDIGYLAINRFFETFTSPWLTLVSQHNFDTAAANWITILQLVRHWELQNKKRIHKGTPYYFLAASYLYSSNYDSGFRYLFDAIEEDMKASKPTINPLSYKAAPAYMLASLVDDERNYLYGEIVSPARSRIGLFLDKYRTQTKSSLTMKDFDARFLNNSTLEFPKLYFVYVLLHLIKLEKMWDSQEPQNDFLKMRYRDVLLDLCLVIDEILRAKPPGASGIGEAVFNFLDSKKWLNASDKNAGFSTKTCNPWSPEAHPPHLTL